MRRIILMGVAVSLCLATAHVAPALGAATPKRTPRSIPKVAVPPTATSGTSATPSSPGAAKPATGVPPAAPVRDVVDTHWGVQVHDPYRYMENLKDPHVQAWIKGQADHANATLARVPGRDELFERIRELDTARPFRILGIRRMPDGRLFYLRLNAEDNLARLCTRQGFDGTERVLVDPATIPAPVDGHWSISFYRPSPDGRTMLYGLALSGSEEDRLHAFDIASGKPLPDSIDRMEDGYTDPMWLADSRGFYYSRRVKLPAGAPATEVYKNSVAYLHRLGTDRDQDRPAFGRNLWPNVAMSDVDFPSIVLTPGSSYAVGKIKHGDSNPLTLYAAPLGGDGDLTKREATASPWTMICDVADSVTDFAVHGDQIFLMTALGAQQFKVVRTSLSHPSFAGAALVLPAGDGVVDNVATAHDALYVSVHRGAASQIVRIGYDPGAPIEPLAPPDQFPSTRIISAEADVDGVVASAVGWTRASRSFAYDVATKSFVDTRLSPTGKFDNPPDLVATEVEVRSHDGTMVPLSIIHRRDLKLDGSNPTLVTGYGSYGDTRSVNFSPTLVAWFERGGVYAVAHVRGGGEKGEAWHRDGQKLKKPNTWKDFIACAEYMVKQGYTTRERLAGQGGSAGGITIGRAVTDRPDLFAAALFDVGSLDCIRAETTTNGVPNIQEFGTVTKEDEFRGLLEMSTYHHVKDGEKYPAIMLSAGMNDPRVDPWESAKTCARLQAATASGKPVLFRVQYNAGHGIGSTRAQQIQLIADRYAFLLWQMGLLKPLP